jgi:tRNA dimethylallyltransferase
VDESDGYGRLHDIVCDESATVADRAGQIGLCPWQPAWLHGCVSRLLHILTGCTAVGKTELALRWAEENGAEIISCDSLLFYRGMDLGTAKPTRAEQARVPHHLIDVCGVAEPMDIARYVVRAREAVDDILARRRQVLVAGGSGFYLKAFLAPVADAVVVPAELRAELQLWCEAAGLPALVGELRRLNPAGLGGLDEQNPRRVLRALERCRASGRTLAELRADFAAQPSPFADCAIKLCELGRAKEDLDRRIDLRVEAMLAGGLIAEVRDLLAGGLQKNPSAARAIGYRETIDFLEGRLPASELAGKIAKNTRALVKKQRTWFKTQLPEHRQLNAGTAGVRELFG